MSTLASIGAAIRAAREQKKLTASQLCESTGLSRVTLRELENGLGNSRLGTVLAVCDALGLELVPTPHGVSSLVAHDEKQRPTELSDILEKTRLSGLSYRRSPSSKERK